MGDGINNVSALHAADVGISVASAVDVVREAADSMLIELDLSVSTPCNARKLLRFPYIHLIPIGPLWLSHPWSTPR
jgi:high-affinity K+ transport system ATPase subunit B